MHLTMTFIDKSRFIILMPIYHKTSQNHNKSKFILTMTTNITKYHKIMRLTRLPGGNDRFAQFPHNPYIMFQLANLTFCLDRMSICVQSDFYVENILFILLYFSQNNLVRFARRSIICALGRLGSHMKRYYTTQSLA